MPSICEDLISLSFFAKCQTVLIGNSGFNHEDTWGHRAAEPQKAVICSIALARLRTDIKGDSVNAANAVGMAQKLLLFWRKPARRCWWEGVELDNVEGVEGKLKVWIRRVWTLEMVSIEHHSSGVVLIQAVTERDRIALESTPKRRGILERPGACKCLGSGKYV